MHTPKKDEIAMPEFTPYGLPVAEEVQRLKLAVEEYQRKLHLVNGSIDALMKDNSQHRFGVWVKLFAAKRSRGIIKATLEAISKKIAKHELQSVYA